MDADIAKADSGRIEARLIKVEYQLNRFPAEEFWHRGMREIAEVLSEHDARIPAEIMPELRT